MQNIHEGLLINLNPSNVVSNKPNGTKINKGKLLKETYKVMNNFPDYKTFRYYTFLLQYCCVIFHLHVKDKLDAQIIVHL